MPGPVGGGAIGADPVEIGARGEQPVADMDEAALDDVRPVKRREAEDEIGLAPIEIEQAEISDQFDRHLRMQRDEGRDVRGQHDPAEPVGRGQPQLALQGPVTADELALERQRLLLHALGTRQHRRAFVGQPETRGGALEQGHATGLFEAAQPPPGGRLAELQPLGRGGQRARARDREEQAEIVPVESLHAQLHRAQRRRREGERRRMAGTTPFRQAFDRARATPRRVRTGRRSDGAASARAGRRRSGTG